MTDLTIQEVLHALPLVISAAGLTVTIVALLLLGRSARPALDPRIRAEREHWSELPRQACPACASVRWYTAERHAEPRHDVRRCTDCGNEFLVFEDWLRREEQGRP